MICKNPGQWLNEGEELQTYKKEVYDKSFGIGAMIVTKIIPDIFASV